MTDHNAVPCYLPGRVLVVESPSVFREMQSLLLRGAGYDVQCCDDHLAAVQTLSRQRFDLLIFNTDAVGTGSAGYLEALRRTQEHLSIIHISSEVTEATVEAMTKLGVGAVLKRPVNPRLLVRTIDEVMGFGIDPGSPKAHDSADTGSDIPSDIPAPLHDTELATRGEVDASPQRTTAGPDSFIHEATFHFGNEAAASTAGTTPSPAWPGRVS